jgi:BirA family biotin operon repressor/biotin-[acetyl-CoA-carboxylase] ligase
VLVAEHQTAGRGRLDRGWVTPPRCALTFSALLDPVGVSVARWPWLPLLAGLAVTDAVRSVGGVDADLKWPNDVMVAGEKLAGILVERVERPGRPARPGDIARDGVPGGGAVAVLGIGLNVTTTAEELPVPTATSLLLASGVEVDRGALLIGVLEALAARLDAWQRAAGDPARALHGEYLERCGTVGLDVRVELPGGTALRGRAEGIDAEGRLLVRPHDGGSLRALGAGDVTHVRRLAVGGA